MGQFESGKWLIGLFLYFVIFFLIVLSISNIKAWAYHPDPNVVIEDPGFYRLGGYYAYGGKCDKPADLDIALIPYGAISCRDLVLNNMTCGNIDGCAWQNDSWFTGDYCYGNVNRTYYAINSFVPCNATGLQSQELCKIFKCSWTNSSELYTQSISPLESQNTFSMFWETAKIMLGFHTDIGLTQFNWLFVLMFTYLPLLMMFYALYMALPFLH
jgi:hypothetical protein